MGIVVSFCAIPLGVYEHHCVISSQLGKIPLKWAFIANTFSGCENLLMIFFFFSSVKVSSERPHPPPTPVVMFSHFWMQQQPVFVSQVKAEAWIRRFCDPCLRYSSCADFQPFKRPFRAHGRFWSVSPAGQEIILICRTISVCLLQKYGEHTVSFFFMWDTKGLRNASTSQRSAARITQHTFGPGVFNHPSSKPASLSFYHCHNGSSAFVLHSKDDVWYAALSLVISNDNKSVLVGPQGSCEKWKYAVWALTLSPYGDVVSLASCRAYYHDKLLRVLDATKTQKKLPASWMLLGWLSSAPVKPCVVLVQTLHSRCSLVCICKIHERLRLMWILMQIFGGCDEK